MREGSEALRTASRGLGELMVTTGLVVLLFLSYQLVWTNLAARRATDRVADDIRAGWSTGGGAQAGGAGSAGSAGGAGSDFVSGKGFAFLHIPRLGRRYSVPVVQGVELPDLARGVGHYPGTAAPGAVGNFAVAGHRATNGEPFATLDRVRTGDRVIAETKDRWFVYVVDSTRIVSPTSTWVLDPVPGKPAAVATDELITLTTCNPRWASYERLIVFGHLVSSRPRADGPPPVLAAA